MQCLAVQAFSVGARSISSRSSRFAAMLDEGARAERGLEARKSERGEGTLFSYPQSSLE